MSEQRVPLYNRLPEIYRIRDEEQLPPGQLKSYLALVEAAFGAIHENIETLYHDLFIETCDDWVIPYIADLLGTTHLKGDSWTLRADVADTIALRRRKGTLGAIAQLTYDLTKWGVHCVELRENLVWNQHLNHQRPDMGGKPPYKFATQRTVIRGGTMTLRDPAMLSLLNTPFDPFAHTADLKPPALGNIRYNLPNLAIFLWRLVTYRVEVTKPVSRGIHAGISGGASSIVRFDIHLLEPNLTDPSKPFTKPIRLFNVNRYKPNLQPPVVSLIDETPSPIPTPRLTTPRPPLTQESAAGAPEKYVTVETYNSMNVVLNAIAIGETGLQLHLPESTFSSTGWRFRGANLCAWETGLNPPLQNREIAIDPIIGRIAIGVNDNTEANALVNQLLLTYTYGAVGPVGAHPISRPNAPKTWQSQPGTPIESVTRRKVKFYPDPADPDCYSLQDALTNIENLAVPLVVEIMDSMTYDLDINVIPGTLQPDGSHALVLNKSLLIRASSNQRPIIKLVHPLQFCPKQVEKADELTVRLEGLYLTRGDNWNVDFPPDPLIGFTQPLIARAALHKLEILDCTLDPGGSKKLDGTLAGSRTAIHPSLNLRVPYGFSDADEKAFNQTPEIVLHRSIAGPLQIDTGYCLCLCDSILDAGKGVDEQPDNSFAVTNATDPLNQFNQWGPPTTVNGITVFGRMRVESICGQGGIWVHSLKVLNNQKGCLKFSYFSGKGDRIPQNYACVTGKEAKLRFVSEIFGQPAYGQLHETTDFRIREQGLNDDAMGAFGFLLEAHKWRNLQIRYREFMPVGIRPLLIPVT